MVRCAGKAELERRLQTMELAGSLLEMVLQAGLWNRIWDAWNLAANRACFSEASTNCIHYLRVRNSKHYVLP